MNHLLIAPILLPLVTACLLLLVGDRKHRSQAALGGLRAEARFGPADRSTNAVDDRRWG